MARFQKKYEVILSTVFIVVQYTSRGTYNRQTDRHTHIRDSRVSQGNNDIILGIGYNQLLHN